MSTATEPVAVWDVRDDAWRRDREAKTGWLKGHSLPAGQMYRAEFYLLDAPFARIFCYALNDEGRVHLNRHHVPGEPHDHSLCEIAREEPRDVLLSELPPPELR